MLSPAAGGLICWRNVVGEERTGLISSYPDDSVMVRGWGSYADDVVVGEERPGLIC
jgi:hypothetical protein